MEEGGLLGFYAIELFSKIEIDIIRKGKVRKAKLYYLRTRKGKSARIAEKLKKKIGVDVSTKIEEVIKTQPEINKDEKIDLKKSEDTDKKKK